MGSPLGLGQGAAGTYWNLLYPVPKTGSCSPDLSRIGLTTAPALNSQPLQVKRSPALSSTPCLLEKKEGPLSVLSSPDPKLPHISPQCPFSHTLPWLCRAVKLPAQCPQLSPSLLPLPECFLCLLCFYDLSQALCQLM